MTTVKYRLVSVPLLFPWLMMNLSSNYKLKHPPDCQDNSLCVFCRPIRFEFLFHEYSQYTSGVWKYCGVYEILRYLSINRLYTKMLRIHLFRIFTSCARPLRPLKTLTSVLLTITQTLIHNRRPIQMGIHHPRKDQCHLIQVCHPLFLVLTIFNERAYLTCTSTFHKALNSGLPVL